MARRLPSTPPVLPGFQHVHIMGTGGFADVFLYEQNLPRRPVAVKVMLADLVDESVREMFRREVNAMGRLSSHPSILTVYGASVSSDGRPYLVMELCSPIIGERFRDEPYSVQEALEIAIRIGSALETAHRAGTLHRDVKPGNIMTTAYGHPVLSDFGIAGNVQSSHGDATGVSVPWSAPEVLREETSGTIASEVWSFAATLRSLITGRSPAEIPGKLNGHAQLTERIVGDEIAPLPRELPAALRAALERGMHKKPSERYASILPMLIDLQHVQRELGYDVTPVEVAMDPWTRETEEHAPEPEDDVEELRLRARATRRRRRPALQLGDRIDISQSTQRPPEPKHRRRVVGIGIALASLVVLAIVVVAALALSSIAGRIPVVDEVRAEAIDGGVVFSWDDPGLVDTDSYLVRTSAGEALIQRDSTFTMVGDPGTELCVEVHVNRDGTSGDGVRSCESAGP